MFTVSHDYYGILGVSKNATSEEIKVQYRKLIRKHHPDQFKGLRAKYQDKGDEDLLRVIDEKIREADEQCKLINEAFEVLSDPIKRKQYDGQVVEPSVPLPEISIHPTKIAFGSLPEGQNKSLTFTIENKGGPPTAVNIDWEGNKPDWGELVIEPDAEKVFPIKVTVKVDTTGTSSGPKDEKILVDVDGRIHMVEVFLAVTSAVVAPATRARPPTPPTKTRFAAPPAPRFRDPAIRRVILALVIIAATVFALVVNDANQRSRAKERSQQAWATQTAIVQKQSQEATVQAKATIQAVKTEQVLALEREAQLLKTDSAQLVSLVRIRGDLQGNTSYGDSCSGYGQEWVCMDHVWGEYSLTNKSKILTLTVSGLKSRISTFELRPGETKSVYLLEYFFKDEYVWVQNSPCIDVSAKDASRTAKICVSPGDIPKDDRRLSSLVQLDFWKYEDNLFYLIRVDRGLNHFIGVKVNVDAPPPGRNSWHLTRINDEYRGWDDPVWSPPPGEVYSVFDLCDFGHRPCRFFPGKAYKAYTFSIPWGSFHPNKKCVELSAPYFNSEVVCKDIGNSPP